MMNRTVSAEETTVSRGDDSPPKKKTGEIHKETLKTKSLEPVSQDNYECSICLSWLRDPVLTKCGHRFCGACLEEWRKKKNSKCPLDDMNLSLEDIFPDNYTKREIEEMRKSFPEKFEFDSQPVLFECRFSTIGCEFKTTEHEELEKHIQEGTKEHLDLFLSNYLKTQYLAWDPIEKSKNMEKEAFFRQQTTTRDLINAMYERIVVLEQQNREQAIKIEKLESLDRRHGTLVWKIDDVKKKIELMQNNPNMMFYSLEAYTCPTGYKFCARINLSHKIKDYISFHVHLMRSSNDVHLSWPFIGRIKISMIHPKNSLLSQHDCIMSKPEILAFHRPSEHDEICPRGFGFTEYSMISDIIKKGFVDENDCLIFKIQMNIV